MLSLVTIVFSGDLALQRLQAQSIARWVRPEVVTDILLVMNEADEPSLRHQLEQIQPDYGDLAAKVRIVGGDEILMGYPRSRAKTLWEWLYVDHRGRLPFLGKGGWRGGNGYRMQQALKLASARVAGSEHVLVLDSKNLFLRDLEPAEFFDERGRARATRHAVSSAAHRDWLHQSLAVMGVTAHPTETTGYETPNPICRSLMLRVLGELAQSHGSVQALFASKTRPSEFMLLFASCLRNEGDTDRFYGVFDGHHLGLWNGYAPEKIDAILAQAETAPSPTFGLHRRVLPELSAAQKDRLIALFAARDLDITPILGTAKEAGS